MEAVELQDFYEGVEPVVTGNMVQDVGIMTLALSELEWEIEDKENALKVLIAKRDQLKREKIPAYFFNAGVSEVTLTNGSKVKIEKKFTCSPNKNIEDKAVIEQFLADNNMKDIMTVDVHVVEEDIPLLQKAGIGYIKSAEVNTATLKSALREACGYGKGMATIQEEDIPNCIHFYKWDEAKIEVPKTRKGRGQ